MASNFIELTQTPIPFRSTNPTRNSYENELWHDMANTIFVSETDSLSVHMPVAGRIWITAQADLDGLDTLSTTVNGTTNRTINAIVTASSVINDYADLPAGIHTIGIETTTANMSNILIMVRRGRKHTPA